MTKAKPLTPKQDRFCREYVIDLNATQAAIRAGYSARVAEVSGYRLLRNAKVAERIAELQKKIAGRLDISAERVLQELARIALSDARKLFDEEGRLRPVSEWDDDTAAAVAGVDVAEINDGSGENRAIVGYTKKLKLWDKVNALVKLGQHLGMFRETNVNVNVTAADLERMSDDELDKLYARLSGR